MARSLLIPLLVVALALTGGCNGAPTTKGAKPLAKATAVPAVAAATPTPPTATPSPPAALATLAASDLELPAYADIAAAADDTLYMASADRLWKLVGTTVQAVAGSPGGVVPTSNTLDGLKADGVALAGFKLACLDGGGLPLLLDLAPDGHTYRLNRLGHDGRFAELYTTQYQPMVLAVADGLAGALVIVSDSWPPGFHWPDGAVLQPPTYAAMTHYEAFKVSAGQPPLSQGRLVGDAFAALAHADAFGRDVDGKILLRSGSGIYQLDLALATMTPLPGPFTAPAVDGAGSILDASSDGTVSLVRADGTRQALGPSSAAGGRLGASLTPAGNTYLSANGKVYRLAGGKAKQLTGAGS